MTLDINLQFLFSQFGEGGAVTFAGLAVGLGFGALAQRSRFCLRAAVIEVSRGVVGSKTAIWLLAFGAAIASVQALIAAGLLDVSEARQLNGVGSLSGAIIGGLMFGVGMILARGCASRLLVLSATGNLRALVSGLILTLVAQASLRGGLSPFREWLGGLWTVGGEASRDLTTLLGFSSATPLALGIVIVFCGLLVAARVRLSPWIVAGTLGVGVMIAVGWFTTYTISLQSFNPVGVKSISFTGPSADTLMGFINQPSLPLVFDLGLIPGVFAGSFLAALFSRELKLQCFSIETSPMPRYVGGAALMGFGGMLAGGCAVGAGMTGGSIFALTAWVALSAMWAGAAITDTLVDRRRDLAAAGIGDAGSDGLAAAAK